MNNLINYAGAVLILVVIVVLVLYRKRKRNLDDRYFQAQWTDLQQMCRDKKLWYKAVIDADDLLDQALKQKHYHGKSTGERLVSAQRELSSNDTVWFGHKLKNRIVEQNYRKLNKTDTLEALSGFRQALKDLGALAKDKTTGIK